MGASRSLVMESPGGLQTAISPKSLSDRDWQSALFRESRTGDFGEIADIGGTTSSAFVTDVRDAHTCRSAEGTTSRLRLTDAVDEELPCGDTSGDRQLDGRKGLWQNDVVLIRGTRQREVADDILEDDGQFVREQSIVKHHDSIPGHID